MARILIVDDDAALRKSFAKILEQEGHEVLDASSGEAGVELYARERPDLVVQDVRLPGIDGLTAFGRMQAVDPKVQAIVMTAYGATETAIKATQMGAFDYVFKPFDVPEMLALIAKALEAGRFMRSHVEMDAEDAGEDAEAIVGRSRAMQEVYKAIGRVASTDATVLVRGESGTGKELVARAVYQHSRRASKPFLVINCVAIPETLLESELFGYERGAFTGASARRIGRIEQAAGGTVFLDEIGDMPLSIQAKVLRLLQEKSIERLGGRESIPVDVRVIAATNRDLERAIAAGAFREDLYYRLKVVTISLPPLRERKSDVPLLADYFLARFSRRMGMDNPGLDPSARDALAAWDWPGNVRELGNAVQKCLIFHRGGPLTGDEVRAAVTGPSAEAGQAPADVLREYARRRLAAGPSENAYAGLTDEFGHAVIAEALALCGDNRSRAAKLLGLSRPTLLAKMERLGLRSRPEAEEENGKGA